MTDIILLLLACNNKCPITISQQAFTGDNKNVQTNYCQGKAETCRETNSLTTENCTEVHAKKIHGCIHAECKQTNRHAGGLGDMQAET